MGTSDSPHNSTWQVNSKVIGTLQNRYRPKLHSAKKKHVWRKIGVGTGNVLSTRFLFPFKANDLVTRAKYENDHLCFLVR